jgi:hypothetical protein
MYHLQGGFDLTAYDVPPSEQHLVDTVIYSTREMLSIQTEALRELRLLGKEEVSVLETQLALEVDGCLIPLQKSVELKRASSKRYEVVGLRGFASLLQACKPDGCSRWLPKPTEPAGSGSAEPFKPCKLLVVHLSTSLASSGAADERQGVSTDLHHGSHSAHRSAQDSLVSQGGLPSDGDEEVADEGGACEAGEAAQLRQLGGRRRQSGTCSTFGASGRRPSRTAEVSTIRVSTSTAAVLSLKVYSTMMPTLLQLGNWSVAVVLFISML